MTLEKYILKYRNKLNNLQEVFVRTVFYTDFGELGLDLLEPETEIAKPDGSGFYRIDFTINTKYKKYAIECDGLYYHAAGAVTTEYFNELQKKQNEIICQDYKLIRFTNNSIRNNPEECNWELRRNFIADEYLYKLYINNYSGINPHEVQLEALNEIEESRKLGCNKGLVVLATGLGKTYLAAFDVKRFKPKKVLFVVHIIEILKQTMKSFQNVMTDESSEMGLFTGDDKSTDKKYLFASIQSLSRKQNLEKFSKSEFDYIIVDESHHTAAPTYSKLFSYFLPKYFLGLTATPDRMDQKDILSFYDNNLIYEISQEEAIKRGFLVPFKYYGFKDNVDYSSIYFNGFRYDIDDLNKLLLIEKRDEKIISKFKEMAPDRKTIAFCVSIEHAEWSCKKFNETSIKSIAIHSKLDKPDFDIDQTAQEKNTKDFRDGKYQVAFVVNMFNEGIDIPNVDCLLFLRPTESKTIFVQHMGRGLRISPDKEDVLILDFIGNYKTAGLILTGLGIKSFRDLKEKKITDQKELKESKELFVYDNNGCEVAFEEKVVDIFKLLDAKSNKKAAENVLSKEWLEYGEYLKEFTTKNLYWKRGQQNQYFETQLEGLRIIADNPDINETDFKEKIQDIVNKKYPGKDMSAGFRALFISKITGLYRNDTKKPTESYYEISSRTDDFTKTDLYTDIITRQTEKIFYWNSIYGSYNKYIPEEKRSNFAEFAVYPVYFIYSLLLALKNDLGYDAKISNFEFNSFVVLAKSHDELDSVIERVTNYRNYEEKYELGKYLNEKNKIDPRFKSILYYNNNLSINAQGDISIREGYEKIVEDLVAKFNKKINEGLLVNFASDNEKYLDMLYSKKSLIDY